MPYLCFMRMPDESSLWMTNDLCWFVILLLFQVNQISRSGRGRCNIAFCVVSYVMYISYKRKRGICRCTLHSTNVSIPANRQTTRHYEWVVYCWRSGDVEVADAMRAAADVETANADRIPIRCWCCRCRCCGRCCCCSVAVS